MTPREKLAAEFEQVISGWGDVVRCQTRRTGSRCTRPAFWLFQSHCCTGEYPVCTQHANIWRRNTEMIIAATGLVRCRHCGREFLEVEQFGAVRPL